jgi:hypothetical protein
VSAAHIPISESTIMPQFDLQSWGCSWFLVFFLRFRHKLVQATELIEKRFENVSLEVFLVD